MNLEEQVEAILQIQADAYTLLSEIQGRCEHPRGEYNYESDGGGYYDPASYWMVKRCACCQKTWFVESGEPGYNNPGIGWNNNNNL